MAETIKPVSISTALLDVESVERGGFRCVFSAGFVSPSCAMHIVFGDLHGNIRAAQALSIQIQRLFGVEASAIFQVGDFGYWPAGSVQREDEFYKESDALDFAERIAPARETYAVGGGPLEVLNAPFFFIRGNHEDLVALAKLSGKEPTSVATGFWFVPDEFVGDLAGLRVLALGGILRDTERGRGKRNKRQRKAAQAALATDLRFSDAARLVLPSTPIQMLLTHSGPASREKRHGSQRLDRVLSSKQIPVHFYGHHHRFSIESKTEASVSIGLRNLAVSRGRLLGGAIAVLFFRDRENFEVVVHEPPSISKLEIDS